MTSIASRERASPAEQRFPDPDRVLFSRSGVRVGAFRCPVHHPKFSTAGAIEGYTVVFPRSAVWIRPEGSRPFVADPGVITIYNRGQPYERRPLTPEGDRCDWFSVSGDLAFDIVAEINPRSVNDPERPFPVAFAPSSAALYYRQRRLFTRVVNGSVDPFEVEQEVILLVGAALARSIGPARNGADTRRRDRDLVEMARAELARDPFGRPTVREVAQRIGASPFHLCRVFRRLTGMTLHHYLLDLRTRHALERVGAAEASLSQLAHELGFSSHSHFTSVFRSRLGFPPSRARAELSETRV